MSKHDAPIPFRKTLSFKLFVSYCAVVLVTIATTMVVHVAGVRHHIRPLIKEECIEQAQDLQKTLEQQLAVDEYQDLDYLLQAARGPKRFGVSFVSFGERPHSRPPFHLTTEEVMKIKSGVMAEGSAKGRVKISARKGKARGRRGGKFRGRPGRPGKRILGPKNFVAVPLRAKSEVIGSLVVFSHELDHSRRSKMLLEIAVNGLLIAIFPALFCAFILSRNLTTPIRKMKSVAIKYKQGDFAARTELKREDELGVLARTFDDMAAELEENVATRQRLLDDVSHELGTPISTIRATLEALIDNLVEQAETGTYLESSLQELEHLSRIVKDVTELSRFETGEIVMLEEEFRAGEPALQSVQASSLLAQKRNVSLELLSSPEVTVVGDKTRISQVIKNLIMNAIVHNPEGTKVQVFWEETSDRVRFVIADNGPAISEEHAKRIFERFYKVSRSRTRDESSSGLGLAIVTRILHSHGSTVEFRTTAAGKEFFFSLSRACKA